MTLADDHYTGEPGGSQDFVARLSSGFAAVAGWSYDNRWWVLSIAVGVLAGSFYLAASAEIDSSYEAYFDANDPTFLHYEEFREDFGSDEVSYILYEAPGIEHGPWNYEVMRSVVALTETLEDEVPFIYEVQSLANAELMVGRDDAIDIYQLSDAFPDTQQELLTLRDRYLNKPMFVGGILSEDAKYAAIIIEMDRSSTDPLDEIRLDPEQGDALSNLYPQATNDAIDEILARPEYSNLRFYHSGDVPLNAAFNVVIAEESAFLDGITAAVVALLLLFFFRNVVGVVGPILVVQISVIATVGFVVLMGWKLDMSFGGMPTLLTAIGVAHSVHILSEFRARFAQLGDRREALVQTIYLVGAPCLFTSVTTAIGFASMSFAPIKSIAHQGGYAAFGVMASFFLSFTLLMALLSFGRRVPSKPASPEKIEASKGGAVMQRFLNRVVVFVSRQRVALLATFGVTFILSIVGISRMVVDSNWLNDFSDRMPLKHVTIKVDEVMGGAANLIFLFDGGASDSVLEPAVLAEIDRVQTWASDYEIVRKSYSIVDVLKDLNQTFHGDDPAHHKLPESRELNAQYLILYESAGGSEANKLISSDYRNASLELRLALAMTSETAEIVDDFYEELETTPLEASTTRLTGIGALWVKLLDYIVSSQVNGFTLAFAAIAIVMCVLFRSIKVGLIAMVPNISPVLLTLGVMGWLGIPLDYNKVAIASVAMGIAVDDTIHLMSRIRHEFYRLGNYQDAVREAMTDVGRALLITSAALVLGFLVLNFSLLNSNAVRGSLLATTILAALIADFLLMPALILTFKPFGAEKSPQAA